MTRLIFDRRQAILGMGAALMMSSAKQAIAADGDFAARLADMQRDGRVSGLHALLVSRGGRTLFEYYGVGEDERLGASLGKVTFGPTVLHDLRSVTKSLVGMLYGIALADGKVPPPEARLYDQFPEYPDLASQPGRDRITVAHALSMTMGTEWDELTFPYGDPRNSENQDGGGARSLSLHPVSSDRRRAGREMDLLRRRHGAARPPDRQGHRGEAARTMRDASCSIRSGWGLSNGRPMAKANRAPLQAGACARPISCASARWCWRTAPGRASRSCRPSGSSDRRRPPSPSRARGATAGTGISASFPSARRVTGRTHDQRHRLGRPAPVPRAGARPRGCHECRQLPPADPGAGPHRHRADHSTWCCPASHSWAQPFRSAA